MEVGFGMLAVFAELAPDGKVSVIGGDIDTLKGKFPATLGMPLYVVLKLIFYPGETERDYELVMQVISPSGNVIQGGGQTIRPGSPARPNLPTKVGVLLILQGLTIPEVGDYLIRFTLNGRVIKELPLYIESLSPDQKS